MKHAWMLGVFITGGILVALLWCGPSGLSPSQQRELDSLRRENTRLDSVVGASIAMATRTAAQSDSAQRANRRRSALDSAQHLETVRALHSFLSDTATVVSRMFHNEVLAVYDVALVRVRAERNRADSGWTATSDSLRRIVPILSRLWTQNGALLAQVNSLAHRVQGRLSLCASGGYGATVTNGRVVTGPALTVGLCYRLR